MTLNIECWKSLRTVLYAWMLNWSLNQVHISFFILYFLREYLFYYFHYIDMYCKKTFMTIDGPKKKKVIIYFKISCSWFFLKLLYFLNIIKENEFLSSIERGLSVFFFDMILCTILIIKQICAIHNIILLIAIYIRKSHYFLTKLLLFS